MALPSIAKTIWEWFKRNSEMSDFGIAGLIGNLYAESGLVPNRKQGDFTYGYGKSIEYTNSVDTGFITKKQFINDKIGYGLSQTTFWSRKEDLYDFAKAKSKSIGELNLQLEFIMHELQTSYKSVYNALCKADTVRGASDFVLIYYETPAGYNTLAVQEKRASYSQEVYASFHGSTIAKRTKEEILADLKENTAKQQELNEKQQALLKELEEA